MATNYFRGDALAVAQVDTVTPANVNIGNTFTVTINGKSITVTATAATVANVTALLATAINASTIAEFLEVSATDNTTNVLVTAKTAGKPFTLTATASGGTATNTRAASIASAGPSHWDTASNWSLGTVPANTNDVIIENSAVDILYGLSQSSVTLNSLDIRATYTGKIGLPNYTGTYYEYRPTYLAIGATTLKVGSGFGSGSGRIKIDNGTVQASVTCLYTASAAETGVESFLWKGTHASNAVQVTRGTMGIAVFAGEVATVSTLKVGYQSNPASDSFVRCGSGVTLTTIDKSGGFVQISSGATTITQTDGTLKAVGDSLNYTTVNNEGGLFQYASNGTITTLNTANKAESNFNLDLRGKTVTNCNRYGEDSSIIDDYHSVTWTNGVKLIFSTTGSQKIRLGTNVSLAVTAL